MCNIQYNIEFFSNWHCGSGLAAGADVDALVVKDGNGLPYVPGRTVKGLLREAAEELNIYEKGRYKTLIDEIFGYSGDASRKEEEKTLTGEAFFGNAAFEKKDAEKIRKGGLTAYLYQTFSSTAIDERTGIAKEHSLRKIETVIPCTLTGDIRNVPEGDGVELLEKSMQMVKRMGTGRNRGYGRCTISSISMDKEQPIKTEDK